MKMHSYMTINGYLQYVSTRSQDLLADLERAALSVGGMDAAIAASTAHRAELDAGATTNSEPESDMAPSISVTPASLAKANTTSHYTDASTANALRKRLTAVASDPTIATPSMEIPNPEFSAAGSDTPAKAEHHNDGEVIAAQGPAELHPLVDHPDEMIAALAREYSEMEAELVSSGPHYVQWPNNITWKNFAVYQVIPTLVYELEYPRTDKYAVISCNANSKADQSIQDPAAVCVREDCGFFGDVCAAVYRYRELHFTSHTDTRTVILPFVVGPSFAVHDRVHLAILHHLR